MNTDKHRLEREQKAEHEQRLCLTCAKYIAGQKNASLGDPSKPDEKERNKPAADFRIRIGKEWFTIEHTRVPFFGTKHQEVIKAVNRAFPAEWIEEVEKGLPDDAHCCMVVPARSKYWDANKFADTGRTAIKKWVLSETERLMGAARTAYYPCNHWEHSQRADDSLVPFQLSLECQALLKFGVPYVAMNEPFSTPNELKLSRRFRVRAQMDKSDNDIQDPIRKAIQDKFPKLNIAKSQGDQTILLVEQPDFAIPAGGNTAVIASHAVLDYFPSEAKKRKDMPDQVFLVETSNAAGPWHFWQLKQADTWFALHEMKQGEWSPTADATTS